MRNEYNTNVTSNTIAGTKQHSTRVKKYFTVLFSIIALFIVVAGPLTYMYIEALRNGEIDLLKGLSDNPFGQVLNMATNLGKDRVTGVVFGVDKGGIRTDVILVCTIDKKNNKFDIISVPRDAKVTLANERRQELNRIKKYVPKSGTMKITEVYAYAPRNKRNEYSVEEVRRILDNIEIDYYVKVDVTAFRKIVDEIGGVEFEVARNLYYRDPVQGLHINLKKGKQLLNGSQAEQLVRFRKYTNGDLDRIKVQQDFLKEFYRQVIDLKNLSKLPTIALTVYQYVDTNFGIADVPEAVDTISRIGLENLTMHTVPGEGKMINGASYFIYDEGKTKEMVDEIFRGKTPESKK